MLLSSTGIETPIPFLTSLGFVVSLLVGGWGGFAARTHFSRESEDRLLKLKDELQEASDRKIHELEGRLDENRKQYEEIIIRYREINIKLTRAILYYENFIKEKGIEIPQSLTAIIGITRSVKDGRALTDELTL